MNPALRLLVERHEGLVTRALVSQVAPSWMLSYSCRATELFRVLPEVYVDAALVRDQMCAGVDPFTALPVRLRRRAALAYAGERAALSHLTALDV